VSAHDELRRLLDHPVAVRRLDESQDAWISRVAEHVGTHRLARLVVLDELERLAAQDAGEAT